MIGLFPSNVSPAPSPIGPFRAIASGNGFTLALNIDGTVACWHSATSVWGKADPDYGVCNIPAGLVNVTLIAAGWLHGIAVTGNGAVVVWGSYVFTNPDGYNTQYLGPANSSSIPATSSNIVAVAGGAGHSIMLLDSGKVVAWGLDNSYNQQSIPAGIQVGGWARATAISTILNNNIALLGNGTVLAWGANSHGQLAVPSDLSNVTMVATGMGQYAVGNQGGGWRRNFSTIEARAWGLVNSTSLMSTGTNVTALTMSRLDIYLLHSTGYVEKWSLSSNISTTLQGLTGVKAMSAGPGHFATLSGCGFNPPSPPPPPPPSTPQYPNAPTNQSELLFVYYTALPDGVMQHITY